MKKLILFFVIVFFSSSKASSGQSIIIDFDKGKINVINSIHTNYDWKKIAISKFN